MSSNKAREFAMERAAGRSGLPPAREQIANAGRSAARAIGAAATGGQVAASSNVIKRRREICQTCDNWTGGRCKLCGCFTSLKIKLATEACPIGKWGVEGG